MKRRPVESLPPSEYLPYRFSRVAEAMSHHLAKIYVGLHGLKRDEWRVMHVMTESRTTTTQHVIANTSLGRLRVSRATISLEAKGLLARVTHPRDQRAHLLQLTPKGLALYEDIAPRARAFQQSLRDALDADEAMYLDRILVKLTKVLEDAGDFAPDAG